jgi:DNA-binding MarR family transcriptional regulator
LKKNGIIRRNTLIQKLIELHKGETGYTLPTINRKIRRLEESGQIVEVPYDRYNFYGIKDLDKRATYFVLDTDDEDRRFIEEILPYLKSKDEAAILATLNEIENQRGKYYLNPEQLDLVVLALKCDNKVIVEEALGILFYHQYKMGKQFIPHNRDLLIKNLNLVLSKFCDRDDFDANILQHCLDILGLLKDPSVVDQLIKDSKSLKKLSAVKGRYEGRFTGESIKAKKKLLFDLEIKLRKTKSDEDTQIANILSDIRKRAAETPPDSLSNNGGEL